MSDIVGHTDGHDGHTGTHGLVVAVAVVVENQIEIDEIGIVIVIVIEQTRHSRPVSNVVRCICDSFS